MIIMNNKVLSLLAAALCSLAAPWSANAQMVLPGEAGPTPSGAVNYAMPIVIPPASGGMAPKLSLNYSNQSGNGVAGMGWGLSGLSSITRCPRSMAQDGARGVVNIDLNDRYCLNGARLIAISGTDGGNGTQYRLESDAYARVVSYSEAGATNGPGSFIVTYRDGSVVEFGKTPDSRVEAQGYADGQGPVLVWAQNRATNSTGLFYDVVYREVNATGEHYPERVKYPLEAASGGALQQYASVEFKYDQTPQGQAFVRADALAQYVGGSLRNTKSTLTSIDVLQNSQLLRSYKLEYTAPHASKHPYLNKISVTPGQLPPLEFQYQAEPSNMGRALAQGPVAGLGYEGDYYAADVNGDGLTDFIQVWNSGGAPAMIAWIANGTGYTRASWDDGAWNRYAGIPYAGHYFLADFNGDGKADLAHVYDSGGLSWVFVWVSTGSGFSGSSWVSRDPNFGYPGQYYAGDFNGDGLTDLVQIFDSGGSSAAIAWISTGSGFVRGLWASPQAPFGYPGQYYTGDFNGDGLTDIAQVFESNGQSAATVWTSNGTGFDRALWAVPQAGFGSPGQYRVGDFNGDGLSDLVQIWDSAGMSAATTWISTGKGFVRSSWASAQPGYGTPGEFHVGDFNGDGSLDLLQIYNYNDSGIAAAIAWISTGDSFNRFNWTLPQQSLGYDGQYFPVNFSGKGVIVDVVQIWSSAGSSAATVWFADATNQPGSLVSSSNGIASQTFSVRTLPSGTSAAYQKNATKTYPLMVNSVSPPVLESMTSSDGKGGTRTTSYKYGNWTIEAGLNGRGSLGFEWVQTKDESTGLTTRTYYRQDFPFIGMVDKVGRGTSEANWNNLGVTTNAYTFKAFAANDASYANPVTCVDDVTTGRPLTSCVSNAVKPGNRYVPYAHQVLDRAWDWNEPAGTFIALPQTRTSTTQDNWGNATQIKVEMLKADGTASGYVKTTDSVFAPADTANWRLGRVLKSSVTSTAP